MISHIEEDDRHQGRLNWSVWRRIIAHALVYKRQIAGLAGFGLVLAVIDALTPIVTAAMIDEATTSGATRRLLFWGLAYGALVIALTASIWAFIVLAGQVATGLAFDLREKGFARLQALSFSYFDTRPVGWLVSRLTADVAKLSSLIPWVALDLVWGSALVVGVTAAMLWLDVRLALVVLVIVPPLAVITLLFQRKLLESSRLVRRSNAMITASYNEGISGVRTTKTLVREGENLREFETLSGDMFRHSMANALQSAVYLPLVIAVGSVGVGLAMWRGGLVLGSGLTLGELIAFMQYAALLYMPIQELARRFTEMQAAQAAAERVQSLLETEPEIGDAPGIAHEALPETIETIEFRHVRFHYQESEPVLVDFDLTVRSGQTVALVGPTGGGKSTIVSLLGRFYEPTAGEILIDGVDYRRRPLDWLQSKLGVVLQTPHLFSGSVRDNIRYGRLDASDAEIEDAARLVNAHEIIIGLDDGYDTEVGEGGGRLSTGQRQLVSLSRAVLADPQIFIMDEATSSVDTETELLIQAGIEAILRDRLSVVIAHRLSTIRKADLILVIEDGRIAERGTHEELLEERGHYYELCQGSLRVGA